MFFQLSEKQPVVLSNQQVVLFLDVLKKVESCLTWLTKLSNQINRLFLVSTDCFFENPNRILFLIGESVLNDF